MDKFTSTISYSRAGFGASELATGPRFPLVIAEELHTVLAQAGVKPPYVLVGHSTGGVYVRVFAARYPGEVVGLVLVEGSHERQSHEINGSDPVALGKLAEVPEGMPAAIKAQYTSLLPMFISGRLDGADKLPDVPMVVLTSLRPPGGGGATGAKQADKMRALHSEIFQSTTYGMHIVTAKSGHFIQVDQPDLVINAIRWVVDAARAPR